MMETARKLSILSLRKIVIMPYLVKPLQVEMAIIDLKDKQI